MSTGRRSASNPRFRRTGHSSLYPSSKTTNYSTTSSRYGRGTSGTGKTPTSKVLKYKRGMYEFKTECPYCYEECYTERLLFDHFKRKKTCRIAMKKKSPASKSKTTSSYDPTRIDYTSGISKWDPIAGISRPKPITSLKKVGKYRPVDEKISIADAKFSKHYRYNTNNDFCRLEDIFMVASSQDQFTHGGRSACTTIALEASLQMLFENIEVNNLLSWNEDLINSILKEGCMMDPQQGNLSFVEVVRGNKRFNERLRIIDEFQGMTKGTNSFGNAIRRLVKSAETNNVNVSAIITKPPETICLYYKHHYGGESDGDSDAISTSSSPTSSTSPSDILDSTKKKKKRAPKFFIVFDSHPRRTDFKSHGGHVIYFRKAETVREYLNNWAFPFVEYSGRNSESLMEHYNSYSFTVITKKEGACYEPFLIPDIIIPKPEINSGGKKKNGGLPDSEQGEEKIDQQQEEEVEGEEEEEEEVIIPKKGKKNKKNGEMVSLKEYNKLKVENERLMRDVLAKDAKVKMLEKSLKESGEATMANQKKLLEALKIFKDGVHGFEGVIKNINNCNGGEK